MAVALVVFQLNVVNWPACTGLGVAISCTVGALAVTVTVTVAAGAAPAEFEAVNVKVVELFSGGDWAEPAGSGPEAMVLPAPSFTVIAVALATLQLRVTVAPGAIALELAVKLLTVGGGGGVMLEEALPEPHPAMNDAEIKRAAAMKQNFRARLIVTFIPYRGNLSTAM